VAICPASGEPPGGSEQFPTGNASTKAVPGPSEVNLQPELDDSRIIILTCDSPEYWALELRIGQPKLRPVEDVKELRAELDIEALRDLRELIE